MKAAVLTGFDQPLELRDVAAPVIRGPHDVIVRVAGAGVCGSDLHLMRGAFAQVLGTPGFPYVLGHENAGHVVEVGSGVTTLRPGDPVLMHPHRTCGLCRWCRRGEEAFCTALAFPGIDGRTPGGFAELVATTERSIVRLAPGTDPRPMASLADAGLTAYHAVRRAVPELPADGTAVVVGVGGVGYFALQLLRLFSPARLVAVDVSEAKLDAATRLGADVTMAASTDLAARVLELTGGSGADLVVDCVGVAPVPVQALAMLRRGGTYAAVGADSGEVCCGTVGLTGRELTIRGNLVGTLHELAELAELVARRRIRLLQRYFALSDAPEAIAALGRGEIEGRAVLVP